MLKTTRRFLRMLALVYCDHNSLQDISPVAQTHVLDKRPHCCQHRTQKTQNPCHATYGHIGRPVPTRQRGQGRPLPQHHGELRCGKAPVQAPHAPRRGAGRSAVDRWPAQARGGPGRARPTRRVGQPRGATRHRARGQHQRFLPCPFPLSPVPWRRGRRDGACRLCPSARSAG